MPFMTRAVPINSKCIHCGTLLDNTNGRVFGDGSDMKTICSQCYEECRLKQREIGDYYFSPKRELDDRCKID